MSSTTTDPAPTTASEQIDTRSIIVAPAPIMTLSPTCTNPASVEMKRDRVDYWVSKGAQMSERVGKLYSKPAATPAASVA